MKKIIKRILAWTLLTIAVTISGVVTIILFPEPLFANKLELGQFTVYSNTKIDKEFGLVLEDASNLVKKSELYDPNYKFDLFLCHNTLFNKIDDLVLGHGPSARATDNNLTIKVEIDPKRDLFFPTFYQNCHGSLTYMLAHEMIHCLQESKYGKLKFNPLRHPEIWKLEGYPEYISRQARISAKDYNLAKEVARYIDLETKSKDGWLTIVEGGCKSPKEYYKSRLMTEYLMNIKRFSYDKILADTSSEDQIYAELQKWASDTKKKRN